MRMMTILADNIRWLCWNSEKLIETRFSINEMCCKSSKTSINQHIYRINTESEPRFAHSVGVRVFTGNDIDGRLMSLNSRKRNYHLISNDWQIKIKFAFIRYGVIIAVVVYKMRCRRGKAVLGKATLEWIEIMNWTWCTLKVVWCNLWKVQHGWKKKLSHFHRNINLIYGHWVVFVSYPIGLWITEFTSFIRFSCNIFIVCKLTAVENVCL